MRAMLSTDGCGGLKTIFPMENRDLQSFSAVFGCCRREAEVPGAGIEPARGFPQGIFVPLQLSLLHAECHAFVVWTLPLPPRAPIAHRDQAGAVKSLHFPGRGRTSWPTGLSSVLQAP
jgi:hypothetical protein